jgi:HAD superfamily hydrolase (TIGR01490 family)
MTQSEIKLAIFDFDDTLFKGQSLSEFLAYMEKKLPLPLMLYAKLRKRFEGSSKHDNKSHKEFLLKPLSYFDKKRFTTYSRQFYDEILKPRLIPSIVNELKEKKQQGYTTIVASGGFDLYVNHFVSDFGVDYCVASAFEFKGSSFTGKILGEEVLANHKRQKLLELMNGHQVNWTESVFYSDHHTDLPIFNLVGKKVVVIQQATRPSWVTDDFVTVIV